MTPKDETPKDETPKGGNAPPWRQPEDEMPDEEYEAKFDKPIDKAEMRRIAEKIARDPGSYSSAKITALRFLRDLNDGGEEGARDSFSDLDELAERRGGGT